MIVAAFWKVGINAAFDERTPDKDFQTCVDKIAALSPAKSRKVKQILLASNAGEIERFLEELRISVDRMLDSVVVIPLYGDEVRFTSAREAMKFIDSCCTDKALEFLRYISA